MQPPLQPILTSPVLPTLTMPTVNRSRTHDHERRYKPAPRDHCNCDDELTTYRALLASMANTCRTLQARIRSLETEMVTRQLLMEAEKHQYQYAWSSMSSPTSVRSPVSPLSGSSGGYGSSGGNNNNGGGGSSNNYGGRSTDMARAGR